MKRVTELKKGFGDLRKAMFNKTPHTDIKKQTAHLVDALKNAARDLERKGVGINSKE